MTPPASWSASATGSGGAGGGAVARQEGGCPVAAEPAGVQAFARTLTQWPLPQGGGLLLSPVPSGGPAMSENEPFSDEVAAERYRLLEAAALLVRYYRAKGDQASAERTLADFPELRDAELEGRI